MLSINSARIRNKLRQARPSAAFVFPHTNSEEMFDAVEWREARAALRGLWDGHDLGHRADCGWRRYLER